jgi:hypothetical protein
MRWLIESEVSVAVFAVAFRGPTGWLPNRLPTASAVAVWLYIEVPACRVSPWRGSKEGRNWIGRGVEVLSGSV